MILVVLAVSTVASLYRVRHHREERAHAGALGRQSGNARPPDKDRHGAPLGPDGT